MNRFEHDTTVISFNLIYQALLKKGVVKNKSQIGNSLSTYSHVIGAILKGKRKPTVDQIQKIIDVYGINANFIFGKSDEMFGHENKEIVTVGQFSKEVNKTGLTVIDEVIAFLEIKRNAYKTHGHV